MEEGVCTCNAFEERLIRSSPFLSLNVLLVRAIVLNPCDPTRSALLSSSYSISPVLFL